MHWRNIQNDEFRDLAMWSAYDDDSSMMDAELEHDGTITVAFGSQPANLTLRFVDWEAISIFNHGNCAAFAYALHQKTGLPLIVFTSDETAFGSWSGHAGVLAENGQVLDIAGFRTMKTVMADYRITTEGVVVNEDEFVALTVQEEYQEDVFSYVGKLERFVLNDFADFIIETHLK